MLPVEEEHCVAETFHVLKVIANTCEEIDVYYLSRESCLDEDQIKDIEEVVNDVVSP